MSAREYVRRRVAAVCAAVVDETREGQLAVLGGGNVCGGPFQLEACVRGPVGDIYGDA